MKKNFFFVAVLLMSVAAKSQTPATDFAGGAGTASDPYRIETRAQLEKLIPGTDGAGVHYRLTADIDLSGSNWTPIGANSDTPFKGKLHGGGHKLANITIPSGGQYGGLFGVLGAGAYIDSLNIMGGNITAATATAVDYRYGAVAGYAYCSVTSGTDSIVIYACSNSANVNAAQATNATTRTGGIVGYAHTTGSGNAVININACVNTGIVRGGGQQTGGIVGYAYSFEGAGSGSISIKYCFNGGNVTGSSVAAHAPRIGGILGHAYLAKSNSSLVISECYSDAKVESITNSESSYIGGLVGHLQGYSTTPINILLDKSYAIGSVVGRTANTALRLAGLIGYTSPSSASTITLSNLVALQDTLIGSGSYIKRVRASGANVSGSGVLNRVNNYGYVNVRALNATSSVTVTSTDTASDNGANITLAQAQSLNFYSTTTSWDFSTTWAIRDGASFPYFRYQSVPVVVKSLKVTAATLDLANATDSVLVYKGASKEYLATLKGAGTPLVAGNNQLELPTSVSAGEELYFVTYEAGKAPSYAVKATIERAVASVSVNPTTASILVGGTVSLTATVEPANATNKSITWSSSDTLIAKVSGGVVTGIAVGVADITVTTRDGGKTATCNVTVTSPLTLVGDGSAANPYEIPGRDALASLVAYTGDASVGKHFKLTADIDLSATHWAPVGGLSNPFRGVLHGDGHQIKNIIVDGGTGVTHIGLFGVLGAGARIENLYMVGGEIKGAASAICAGAIAGLAECNVAAGGTDSIVIVGSSNILVTVTTTSTSSSGLPGVGGLVGRVNTSGAGTSAIVIRNSINTGNITGGYVVGGLVGYAEGKGKGTATFSLVNSYSYAEVATKSSGTTSLGGLVGYLNKDTAATSTTNSISSCYVAGSVIGQYVAGGIGRVGNSSVGLSMLNNVVALEKFSYHPTSGWGGRVYYGSALTSIYNYAYNGMQVEGGDIPKATKDEVNGMGGRSKSLAELFTKATYTDSLRWDFAATWTIPEGKGLPYLKTQSAPVIAKAAGATQAAIEVSAAAVVTVYKGSVSTSPITTLSVTPGDSVIVDLPENAGIVNNDALYFVAAEAGKIPSYPTKAVVVASVPVSSVSLDIHEKSLFKGGTLQLVATVNPADASDTTVTWISTAPTVASVDQTGLATALQGGTARIVVTTNDKGKTDTCTILVTVPVTSITVTSPQTPQTLAIGSSIQLSVTVDPADANNRSVTWSSATPTIASVDSVGTVTGRREGMVAIRATANDGSKVFGEIQIMVTEEDTPNAIGKQDVVAFTLYPNPVKAGQAVNLALPEGATATVRIYDVSGTLLSVRYNVQRTVIAPDKTGIYLLQVELLNGATGVQRIVVE
jgi:uncharacterized protein YjdB